MRIFFEGVSSTTVFQKFPKVLFYYKVIIFHHFQHISSIFWYAPPFDKLDFLWPVKSDPGHTSALAKVPRHLEQGWVLLQIPETDLQPRFRPAVATLNSHQIVILGGDTSSGWSRDMVVFDATRETCQAAHQHAPFAFFCDECILNPCVCRCFLGKLR